MKIILVLIFSIITTFANAKKNIYSKPYIKSLLIENARNSSYVSPALALAVAKVESNYKSDAISNKGAIGIMQIMPLTALMEFGIEKKKLFDPKINIKIGVKFLDNLIKKYKGNISIALSHYNGGSAVGKWPNLKIIPATYPYIVKVIKKSNEIQRKTPTLAMLNNKNKNQNFKFSKDIKNNINQNEIDLLVNDIDKWLSIYNKYKKHS